jgi:transglutaminase-like putative cysteine protease
MQAKRGYCMYFATAMTMLLRHQGIPARFVMGFLPGELAESLETVRDNDAHAWVEVFVPRRGWVSFDPTPRPGG